MADAIRCDRRDGGGLRDELLDGEIFYSLKEAQIVIESWRRHYNTSGRMPRSATGRRRQRWLGLPSRRGRLRSPDQLRRPGPHGPETDRALTFNADHRVGADHKPGVRGKQEESAT